MDKFRLWVDGFVRKHIRAQYKPSDYIGSLTDVFPRYLTARSYIQSSPGGRWFWMIMDAIVLILFALPWLVIVALVTLTTGFPPMSPWLVLFSFLLTLWAAGVVVVQSRLRWMFRNRKRPRNNKD